VEKEKNHSKMFTSENFELQRTANDQTLQDAAAKFSFTFKGRVTHLLPPVKMTIYLIRQAETTYTLPSRAHMSYIYTQHFCNRVRSF